MTFTTPIVSATVQDPSTARREFMCNAEITRRGSTGKPVYGTALLHKWHDELNEYRRSAPVPVPAADKGIARIKAELATRQP